VNNWTNVFLGTIAVATLVTAIMQIAALIAAVQLARRIRRLADTVDHELKPLLDQMNAVGRDASRVMWLLGSQLERVDRISGDLVSRVEDTVSTLQSTVRTAARGGTPFLLGLRAALAVFKGVRRRRGRTASDEDDALFI
jgi:hypothetical protein